MSDLDQTVAYHLEELRDELRNAVLTDAARLASTAHIQIAAIRLLIDPTAAQDAVMEAIVAAFDDIQSTVKRVGPFPDHEKIRKAFAAAAAVLQAGSTVLADAVPSEKARWLGL